MNKSARNTTSARQVELIIRQLDSLSTLPEVAAGFLANLADGGIDRAGLSEIIESDAALSAKILSLAYKERVVFSPDKPSVSEAVSKLGKSLIREAVLSSKVFGVFEVDYDPDSGRTLGRKQLALHGLGVACCARDIAEIVLGEGQRQLAYSAGLLHDIGKLALDEVMPKSFERMAREARSQNTSMWRVEQKHLGVDHTVIGRRLAQKWHLPQEIVLAIWLHHSDPAIISEHLPGAGMAGIVRLADIITRQCEIGMSGSFDPPDSVSELIESLSLSAEQISGIRSRLAGQVRQRSDLSGLDAPGGTATYCELIGETAAKLAHDNTELTAANRQLLASGAHANFVNEFLSGVNADMPAIDVAAVFASGWQKHYQTGPVCVYIPGEDDEEFFEAAFIDDSGRVGAQLIKRRPDVPIAGEQSGNEFAILDAGDSVRPLLEQIECEFNIGRTKTAPLLVRGRVIGGIVFEQRGPGDPRGQLSAFGTAASIGAGIIAVASARRRQEGLAEQFAELLGELREGRGRLATVKSLAAIAEMAAGAAHELNNPLAVISGRVQLLYDGEDDKNKKQMLKQIQERAEEISLIVSDLMSFARPKEPTPKMVSVGSLVDAAVRQSAKAHKLKKLKAELISIDELGEVCVDDEQVAAVIANIISNALESYEPQSGPIRIDGGCEQPEGFAAFAIIDSGRGMDAETLAKAAQPFFSARPAGRKRGMGLAHAQRLLQLNNGSLHLASEAGAGTIVTIRLPVGRVSLPEQV
jgi:putative nucleotidyltransferase with HDIG domain